MKKRAFTFTLAALLLSSCSKNAHLQSTWQFNAHDDSAPTATFVVTADNSQRRQYKQSTTLALRDNAPQSITYEEHNGLPRLRSGDVGFDALFALAVDELKANSVESIRDGAYAKGEDIDCACFETGAKWHYVWTRDLSYAAYLGLSWLDPQRVQQSLMFKTATFREGVSLSPWIQQAEGRQIVQDTGSGGSWPVSTDRISWGLGAASVLDQLSGSARVEFAATVLETLRTTLDNDRMVAFDSVRGLYNGEQSFLDWREQSYANWVKDELTYMATSSALSTNVLYFMALEQAAQLAEAAGENGLAARYGRWAEGLKTAINQHLWLPDRGLYSSLTAGHFDLQPLVKFDWLGQSLAIISGVADSEQRASILANYPHGPMGPPVIFPQQPNTPIYHNRALWPFVTGFGLQAAILGDNPLVVNSAYHSLVRGAALNLSNMENYEWLSGRALWQDSTAPDLKGPVINSQRQLWSVGAYLGMVIEGVFGLQRDGDSLHINPYVTTQLHQRFMSGTERAELLDITWQGKKIDVSLALPETAAVDERGVYRVAEVRLNGSPVGQTIQAAQLKLTNKIEVQLGQVAAPNVAINTIQALPSTYDENVFAPVTPSLKLDVGSPENVLLVNDSANRADRVSYRIYRNGELAATLPSPGEWRDPFVTEQVCYAVEAMFNTSRNVSHHSQPVCTLEGTFFSVADVHAETTSTVSVDQYGPVLTAWGQHDDSFMLNDVSLSKGLWSLQLRYRNTLHTINTGITNAVKWVRVLDQRGKLVAQGALQMPHMQGEVTHLSTPLRVTLPADGRYRIEWHDFYNMSYLQSNANYGAAGGEGGPLNILDLYGVMITPAN